MPQPLAIAFALAVIGSATAAVVVTYREELEDAWDEVSRRVYNEFGIVLPGWSAAQGRYAGFGGAAGGGSGGSRRTPRAGGIGRAPSYHRDSFRDARYTPPTTGAPYSGRQAAARAASSARAFGVDEGVELRSRRPDLGDIELNDREYGEIMLDVHQRPANAIQDLRTDPTPGSPTRSDMSEEEELELAMTRSIEQYNREEQQRQDEELARRILEDDMGSSANFSSVSLSPTQDSVRDGSTTTTVYRSAEEDVRSLSESDHTVSSSNAESSVVLDYPPASLLIDVDDVFSVSSPSPPFSPPADVVAPASADRPQRRHGASSPDFDSASSFTLSDGDEADYQNAFMRGVDGQHSNSARL